MESPENGHLYGSEGVTCTGGGGSTGRAPVNPQPFACDQIMSNLLGNFHQCSKANHPPWRTIEAQPQYLSICYIIREEDHNSAGQIFNAETVAPCLVNSEHYYWFKSNDTDFNVPYSLQTVCRLLLFFALLAGIRCKTTPPTLEACGCALMSHHMVKNTLTIQQKTNKWHFKRPFLDLRGCSTTRPCKLAPRVLTKHVLCMNTRGRRVFNFPLIWNNPVWFKTNYLYSPDYCRKATLHLITWTQNNVYSSILSCQNFFNTG